MQTMMKNMMDEWMKNFGTMKFCGVPGNTDFMKGMDMSKVGRQLTDGLKVMLDNHYEMISKIQEHTEKISDNFLKNNAAVTPEGLKMLEQWREITKSGQKEYKKAIDSGFAQMEAILANFEQSK